MKTSLAWRWIVLLGVAAATSACSDDDDLPINSAGSGGSGNGGRGGSGGHAGSSGGGGSGGTAGASGTGGGSSGGAGTGGTSGASGASGAPAYDYEALCTSYCDEAAAFQAAASATPDAGPSSEGDAGPSSDAGSDAPGGACDGTNPDCQVTCVGTVNAVKAQCETEVRAMFECFVADNTWICGGEPPSSPNPAGCGAEQGAFGACAASAF